MEDYAAKMQLKTDAALREYMTNYAQYREAAVLAAFDELRRRGQPAPEEPALRPTLEAAAATQQAVDAAAEAERQQAALAADPEAAAKAGPALYSPLSIVLFSILPMSTMLTGGVMMCMNLYRLGKKRATLGLAVFIVAYLLLGSVVVNWAVFQQGLNPMWGFLLFNLPAALIYVLWVWPRYVGGPGFRSRSVLVPMLVCMLLVWGLQRLTPYLIRQQPKEKQQELERMMRP